MRVENSQLIQDGIRQLELAALPTAKEWSTWFRLRKRECEMTHGWERALIDSTTRLVKNNLTLARMIRLTHEAKKMIRYDSEGRVAGEETKSATEFTREALAWFITQIKPAAKDAPAWAEILFKANEGCYIQQCRLALELDGIKKRGYLTLNASALAPNPQAFDERTGEVL